MKSPSKIIIPQEKAQRDNIWKRVRDTIESKKVSPPVSLNDLREETDHFLNSNDIPIVYRDFVTVLIGNEVWRETITRIPPKRRLLLLPQCLRHKESCPAQMDAFGVLCEECGLCPIGFLQKEADRLGMTILIAEGTTVVTRLLESGQIDAVIGVGCLSALQRSFPHMTAGAIPGIAIPLIYDGCENTRVDVDWILRIMHTHAQPEKPVIIQTEPIKSEVHTWFEENHLKSILNLNQSETEQIACEWIAQGGKRWRPFLAASVYQAMRQSNKAIPESMKQLAIAVECFHKASLVHDDIEDNDDIRYGQATLHRQVGLPIALNIGDLLIGEGYRLIEECPAPSELKTKLLSAAIRGHRHLCLGQGEELNWIRHPVSLTVEKVLKIFEGKTAPAFEVALCIGALYGGADETICNILRNFSKALGIAYQIQDDIEDFIHVEEQGDLQARRPTLLYALACESASSVFTLLKSGTVYPYPTVLKKLNIKEITQKAWALYAEYRDEAIRTLKPLHHVPLKSLLYRLIYKILKNPPVEMISLRSSEKEKAVY